jgi:hypothetical protein
MRRAILDLPRGIVRERLFVSLVKARKHLQEGHLHLLQTIFASMAKIASDPSVSPDIAVLFQKAQNRLSLLQRSVVLEM